MTLVYRSQRFQKQKSDSRIGPAYYNTQKIKPHSPQCQYIFKEATSSMKQEEGNEVGPGKYQIYGQMGKIRNKQEKNAVFKSGVQRFQTNVKENQEKKKEEDEKKNILGYEEDKTSKERREESKCGKLRKPIQSDYHFNHHRLHQKQNYPSPIPSIPCNDQSYGYRIDNKTNQLVLNQNPYILLANTLTGFKNGKMLMQSLYNGPGAYFRNDGPLQKSRGLKWVLEKSSRQNKENNCNDDEEVYRQVRHSQKSKWEEKGNSITSKSPRNLEKQSSITKKSEIVLNGIRRKFEKFFAEEQIDRVLKMQSLTESENKKSNINPKKIECFLSKETRFRTKQISRQKYRLQIKQNQQKEGEPNKKNVPFQVGAHRFLESEKNNNRVGPGHYQNQIQQRKIGGYLAKQCCTEVSNEVCPGPGTYFIQTKQKRLKKNQTCAKITNRPIKQYQRKDLSMLSQVQNIFSREQNRKRSNDQKKLLSVKETPLKESEILKRISDAIRNDETIRQTRGVEELPRKGMAFKPLLKSVPKVQEKIIEPGPGSFQIAQNMVKKTFNVTYD